MRRRWSDTGPPRCKNGPGRGSGLRGSCLRTDCAREEGRAQALRVEAPLAGGARGGPVPARPSSDERTHDMRNLEASFPASTPVPACCTVEDVMTRKVVTVHPDTSIHAVADLL